MCVPVAFSSYKTEAESEGDVWRWMSPWCSVARLGQGEEVCCQHKQELGTGLGLDGIQTAQLISYTQVVGSKSLPFPGILCSIFKSRILVRLDVAFPSEPLGQREK